MRTLIVAAVAVVLTAGGTFPLGWWLGRRHRTAELRWYRDFYYRAQGHLAAQQQRHQAVVARVLHASLNAMRTARRQA